MYNKSSKIIINVLAITIFISGVLFARRKNKIEKHGKVIFITSLNIYLRFENTQGITKGDTAYFIRSGRTIPVMYVKYLSSNSCSGPKIGNTNLKVGDNVFLYAANVNKNSVLKNTAETEKDTSIVLGKTNVKIHEKKIIFNKNLSSFTGNFTANSLSYAANYQNSVNTQRWDYSLNLRANRIGGSDFYFSNFMDLNYLSSEWQEVKMNVFNNLRIYDLSLGFKSAGYNIWAGRHINYNVSDIGPVDGLQFEKRLGNFGAGGVAGFRPDFYNMGFNSKLFEYGAYLMRIDSLRNGSIQNTVAIFQQTNNKKTDRRFLYFQNNSNLSSKLNFYLSSEVDLFKLQNNVPTNDFSLTSVYFSTMFTPVRNITINFSYDARRNIIYYQTFGSIIDSLFNNALRQGLQLGFFLRPFTGTFINLNGGYSYQKGDLRPSRNFNISVTQSEIPLLNITATLNYNKLYGNYQNGSVYGITISKFFRFNITNISVGYSRLKYTFGSFSSAAFNQKIVDVQISTRLLDHVFLNLYYEGEFDGTTTYNRFMNGVSYRF